MKQIRNGVFETNSSSTHSFTVGFQNTDTHNLVQYGGLRYENLKNLVVNVEDSGWMLVCSRYEEKFSLIVHAVLSYLEDSNDSEEIKNELINILKSRCEYELIILDKDENGEWSTKLFAKEQSHKAMLKILGY